MMLEHLRRMAPHNAWANQRLYAACEQLPDEEYRAPQQASFSMITHPGEVMTPLHLCWLNLLNHQTHHRGQTHDQLSQTAVPPPSLDLIFYIRESEQPS